MKDDSSSRAGPRAPSKLRGSWWRVLVSLLIAGGFVWAMHRGGLPLAPPAHAAAHLRWWGVPGFALFTIACMALRAHRIAYLLRPMRPEISDLGVTAIGLIGYAAIFFAPLRLGEMVRPYLLTQEEGISFTEGLGIIAAERIIDGLTMVAMTALGLALSSHVSPLPDRVGGLPIPISLVPRALTTATWLFTLAFAGMALLYATRFWAVLVVRRLLGTISPRLGELGAHLVQRVSGAFAFLTLPKSAVPFVLSTVASWLFNALAIWVLLLGVGLPASLPIACVAGGIVALGLLLPAGPGFFGAYQVASYTSLAMYFAPGDVLSVGAMFVFASYVAYVVLNVLGALVGFRLLGKARRARPLAAS
jgi:uncharacterized membrane protein YbhN (UPF0104 family)